jgi:hypothetical protein
MMREEAAWAERRARHSPALLGSVRAGFVAYGAVHLLFAWIAIRLVTNHDASSGSASKTATGQGALAQLADDPLGRILLGAMSVLFVILMLWQLLTALVGHRHRSGWRRVALRAAAVCRLLVYGYFAVSCARLSMRGADAAGRSPQSTTARILNAPLGPLLVIAVAAVAVGVGVALVVFGARKSFVRLLNQGARGGGRRKVVVVLGQVGYVAKGLAFIVVGALLTTVALTHDPGKAGGLDQALFQFLGHATGSAAIVVVGLGLGCFGLYLFALSRHLDDQALTSA